MSYCVCSRKTYALKSAPAIVVVLTRNVDRKSILFHSWKWVGPDGVEHGPIGSLDEAFRDMNTRFKLRQMNLARHWWRRGERCSCTSNPRNSNWRAIN